MPELHRILALLLWFVCAGTALASPSSDEIRFVFWNLKNYIGLASPDPVEASSVRKSPASAEVIHRILAELKPDLLLFAEMGTREDLHFLQKQLEQRGVVLPFVEFVEGPDPARHLALLSRFPFKSLSISDLRFTLNQRVERLQRGLLDVELGEGAKRFRLLGLHLKSKRQLENSDESQIRRWEAHWIRKHLDRISEEHPGVGVLVAGDFNETKEQPILRAIGGAPSEPGRIQWVPLQDRLGDNWTYRSLETDTFSRIDFVGFTKNFPWKLDRSRSEVVRDREMGKGSDHRPLLLIFKGS